MQPQLPTHEAANPAPGRRLASLKQGEAALGTKTRNSGRSLLTIAGFTYNLMAPCRIGFHLLSRTLSELPAVQIIYTTIYRAFT